MKITTAPTGAESFHFDTGWKRFKTYKVRFSKHITLEINYVINDEHNHMVVWESDFPKLTIERLK